MADFQETPPAGANQQSAPPDRPAVGARGDTVQRPRNLIEETPPWIYLRDERTGQLVPVVEGTNFDALLPRLDAGATPSKYQLTDVALTGRVVGNRAQMEVAIEMRLPAEQKDLITIPLGIDGVLRDTARYQGPGEASLAYSPRDGLLCLLRPHKPAPAEAEPALDSPSPANSTNTATLHRLRFTIWVAITRSGVWNSMQLRMPVTSWQVDLAVPEAPIRPNAPVGVILDARPEGAGTRITATGATRELRLRWRPDNTPEPQPFLQSHAVIELQAKHPELVRADVRLRVESLAGLLESFRFKLPRGMTLLEWNDPAIDVAEIREEQGRQVLQISPAAGPDMEVNVSLTAVLRRDARSSRESFDAAEFDVVDAVVQTGEIRISADSPWNVRPVDAFNVHRKVPASGNISDAQLFVFSNRPCRLPLFVERQLSQVRVQPEYFLHVTETELQLDMRLDCALNNESDVELFIDLAGWTLREAGPAAAIDFDPASLLSQSGPLIVPLRESSGVAQLRFTAVQRFRPGAAVEIQFPAATIRQPLRDGPATLRSELARIFVSKEDSIELRIAEELSRGLTEDSELARDRPGELAFQENGGDGSSSLTLQAEVRQRQVVVRNPRTEVEFHGDMVRLRQHWDYQIAFGRVDEMEFDVSPATANLLQTDPSRFRLTWNDGQEDLKLEPQWRDDEGAASLSVSLGQSVTSANLTFEYDVPRIELVGEGGGDVEEGELITLPLMTPAGPATLAGERVVELRLGAEFRAELADDAWTTLGPAALSGSMTLVGRASVDHVSLQLIALQARRVETFTLESSWLQTWLNQDQRRDRAAFRLLGAPAEVNVSLPADATLDRNQIVVAIDGVAVADYKLTRAANTERSVVTVPWLKGDDQPHTLELWYQFAKRPKPGRMALAAPQVLGLDARRYYWQVVLPPREHLLGEAVGVSSEMALKWSSFLPEWEPTLQTEKLESWVGAVAREPLPKSANQYLFTGFGPFPTLRPHTVFRSWLVGGVAGGLLLFGMAFLQFPLLRRAPMLLVVAVALGALTLLYPESAALAAQGVALGLVLLVLSLVLRRALSRRPLTVEYHGPAPAAAWTESPSQSRELTTTS